MTVIAWDGTTLAADKMASFGCSWQTCTKIFKSRGHLLAYTGIYAVGLMCADWWDKGGDMRDFPEEALDKSDGITTLWVITPDKTIVLYEGFKIAMPYHEPMFTDGCGKAWAQGALTAGANAQRAVEIACEHNIHCGGGIDTLTLDD